MNNCIICNAAHDHVWTEANGSQRGNMYCAPCEKLYNDSLLVRSEIIVAENGGNVYLGSWLAAASYPRTRICVHEMIPEYSGSYLHKPILYCGPIDKYDRKGARASAQAINDACTMIHGFTKLGMPVMVHCRGGVERSPLVVACYMAKYGLARDLDAAYEHIRKIRPVVSNRQHWLPAGYPDV